MFPDELELLLRAEKTAVITLAWLLDRISKEPDKLDHHKTLLSITEHFHRLRLSRLEETGMQ